MRTNYLPFYFFAGVFSVLALAVGNSKAATIYVPDDYSTIQAAVDAASPGDTIIVRDGTYTENVHVYNDYLRIKSENGAGTTLVVSPRGSSCLFDIRSDYVVIEGFTIMCGDVIHSGLGIRLINASNCEVSHNNIVDFWDGVFLESCSGTQVIWNRLSLTRQGWSVEMIGQTGLLTHTASGGGIRLRESSNNTITDNEVANSLDGIALRSSNNNTVRGNKVSDAMFGMNIWSSSGNIFAENELSENFGDFEVGGTDLEHYLQDIDASNKVDGKPVIYLTDQEDLTIDATWDVGYLALVNCNNITVKDLTLRQLLLAYTANSKIQNLSMQGPLGRISLDFCSDNIISRNEFAQITWLWLWYSAHNTITRNNLLMAGIGLWSSADNRIFLNDLNPTLEFYNSASLLNSPDPLTYIYKGIAYTHYLGNYWGGYYTGGDGNGDGIGDTPFAFYGLHDDYPLMMPFENYQIGGEAPAEPVWVEVYAAGSNLAIRNAPGTKSEVLKRVPDGWVLKVINTHGDSILEDSYTWWEVEDVTDGVSGWSAKEFLQTGDPERVQRIDDVGQRKSVILEAVAHYYNNQDESSSLYSSDDGGNEISILKENSFPIELILAIIAQESGGISFDNEGDYGIMQITGEANRGWGSQLECYTSDCKYYTNTEQGICANIKDGLRVLHWAYQTAPAEQKIQDAVWRYNHGGNDREGDLYYLENVAEKLKTLNEYFADDYRSKLGDSKLLSPEELNDFYNKLTTYQQRKLHSPGELRVYDSQGRVTGLVNGEVRTEISNSDYYQGNVITFSPSDSYRDEVVGTNDGTYSLDIVAIENGETITFEAVDIPTAPGAVHDYVIDWSALSGGEKGAILRVDSEGDGAFEQTIPGGRVLENPQISLNNLVNISTGRAAYDRRTGQFSVDATVKNTSATAVNSPVWLVIESISNPAVTLAGGDGTTADGKPYLDLSGLLGDDKLSPAETISKRVYFNNPGRVQFTFKASVRGVILP